MAPGSESSGDGTRVIAVLGCLFLVLAAVRVGRITVTGGSIVDATLGAVVIGGFGLCLLYGSYWLPESDLHPDVYPRIAAWTVGGFGALLLVLAILYTILEISPNGARIDRPLFAVPLAVGLGSVGGFAIGVNEGRAISRARDAERRNRELKRIQRELEETVEQLEASNDRLEQFAYAASHDLQEPLRMVSTYLQLVDRRYGDDLDAEGTEFLTFAIDGADRMRTMIRSLLAYSRVNTRGGTFESTDSQAVLDDVLEDLQVRIEETDATVTSDDLPRVTADPTQLGQVFRNLLANALVYRAEAPPRVHVGVERTGDRWRFSVSDNGIGIDPEYHEEIFDVFNRLHTPAEYSGTGIGLAVCELIVERHGGEIWVDSDPGAGATFYFTLPPVGDDGEPRPVGTSTETH